MRSIHLVTTTNRTSRPTMDEKLEVPSIVLQLPKDVDGNQVYTAYITSTPQCCAVQRTDETHCSEPLPASILRTYRCCAYRRKGTAVNGISDVGTYRRDDRLGCNRICSSPLYTRHRRATRLCCNCDSRLDFSTLPSACLGKSVSERFTPRVHEPSQAQPHSK